MSLGNHYTNSYLTPDGHYKQDVSSLKYQKQYYEKEDSFIESSLKLSGLLIAATTGGYYLYNGGHLRNHVHDFVINFAEQSGTRYYDSAVAGIKKATNRTDTNIFQDIVDITHNQTIREQIRKDKSNRAKQMTLENLNIIKTLKEKNNVLKELKNNYDMSQKHLEYLNKIINKENLKDYAYDYKLNASMMHSMRLRHATVEDLIKAGKLNEYSKSLIEKNMRDVPDIMKRVADHHVLIDDAGKIVDLRPAIKSIKSMGHSLINDYQIPVLGINPIKMLHLDDAINNDHIPKIHILKEGGKHPIITKNTEALKKPLLFNNGKIIDLETLDILESNVKLVKATKGFHAIHLRQMSGIEVREFVPKWEGAVGEGLFNIAKAVDVGFQDQVYKESFKLTEMNSWLPAASWKISDKISPVESVKKGDLSKAFGKDTEYTVVRESKKIGEEGFIKQFTAGRKNLGEVTAATNIPYMMMERINSALGTIGLGLSAEHMGSAGEIFVNLMARRILPIVAGIGAFKYINGLIKNKDGEHPTQQFADAYIAGSVKVADMKDRLGVTDVMKKAKKLSPGWDQLEELPLIGRLFSTKNKEETEDYWKHGSDPVRKGRYWQLGNTPYSGGKIEYFEPNWAKRVKSNYKFTDVLYGSEDEYFANWWLPTPTHPLAPIKHFFVDPYHYENKHYKDRPYPISGGIAELREIPIIGAPIDATVGRILKPRKKMHLENWQGNKLIALPEKTPEAYNNVSAPSTKIVQGKNAKSNKEQDVLYTTASGQMDIVSVSKDLDIKKINNMLKNNKIRPSKGGMSKKEVYGDNTEMPLLKPRGMQESLEDSYYDLVEMGGFYGFSFSSLAGDGVSKRPRVQSSADMTSYTRQFWDKNLGGLGGDISEILRRFVPHKQTAIKKAEVNPIRNTMPTWMPGSEYYIDFQHGDPYAKVPNGEYRLPGTGYEAMRGKSNPLEMKIGSSFIGHGVDGMIRHFLHVDDIELTQNAKLKDILNNGVSVHNKMEKEWSKMGLAVANEVHVKDKDYGVEGWIDSIIRDKTSSTGYSIVDYKTINDKGFKELKKKGAKPENIAQINFYMYETGQNKAYLHYINRDNPDEKAITFEFNYDKKLMKKTFEDLENARGIIRNGIDRGIINRGDLYGIMDRFRILADVAPYSDNYRYYDKLISGTILSDDEKKEVQEIRSQVAQKKHRLRFYPYKFKHSELKYENVKVLDILENGQIITDKYSDNPIKLAGIRFSHNKNSKEGKESMDYLNTQIKKGQIITIGYTSDPLRKINRDVNKTISAVVMARGKNINKEMMKKNLATENEDDDSPAGIHARFTKGQIRYGKTWETIAHMDTVFNTKFMQVRSPLEQYKRRDLYGI